MENTAGPNSFENYSAKNCFVNLTNLEQVDTREKVCACFLYRLYWKWQWKFSQITCPPFTLLCPSSWSQGLWEDLISKVKDRAERWVIWSRWSGPSPNPLGHNSLQATLTDVIALLIIHFHDFLSPEKVFWIPYNIISLRARKLSDEMFKGVKALIRAHSEVTGLIRAQCMQTNPSTVSRLQWQSHNIFLIPTELDWDVQF